MGRLHVRQLAHFPVLAPLGEPASRLVVGASGIFVADIRGEEAEKAIPCFFMAEEHGWGFGARSVSEHGSLWGMISAVVSSFIEWRSGLSQCAGQVRNDDVFPVQPHRHRCNEHRKRRRAADAPRRLVSEHSNKVFPAPLLAPNRP